MQVTIPTAYEELFRPHRYKVYYGGRGAGKSTVFAIALLLMGYDRKLRILCTREIQRSISDSVHKLLSEQIEALGLSGFYAITRDAIRGANGTEFIFKGLHANSQEIKSTEGIDICWIEEAMSVSEESWSVLIPTVRKEGSEIWVSFNPSSEHDPVYKRFVLNQAQDAYVRKVNYDENPYFPETLRKEMEWLKARDYPEYLHIWEGELKKQSNALIFKDRFSVETFETPNNARFYLGADWGFATDPSTLIRSYMDGRTIYIDHEAWGVGVDIDETPALFDIVPAARDWPIYADCARPETISYMAKHGFRCKPAPKWHGSIEDGIAWLRAHDIVIHSRCKHLIDEFNRYSYKTDKITGDILPIIVDKYNHCLPADTLITCIDGEKKIKDVCVGDYVLTRQGYKKVLWAGITKRNAKTSVLYAGGNKLIATPDHRVYSIERGWVQMESLQKGEHVLCLQKLLKVPTAVQCVKGGAIEPEVYDLTVEEQHEFFANGVLVHNCIDALRYAYSNEIQNRNSSWAGLIS